MTINNGILPNGKQQFIDSNGNPLAGGKVYYYIPSTTTFKTTYLDDAGANANTNPIVLDANGQCIAYGSGSYRQQVYDVNNNLIWDVQVDAPITLTSFSGPTGSSLIGYDQGSTGAIATNVQAKLQQFVTLQDFGAFGNGTTDDTTAVTNAINYINSNACVLMGDDLNYLVQYGALPSITKANSVLANINFTGKPGTTGTLLAITGNYVTLRDININGNQANLSSGSNGGNLLVINGASSSSLTSYTTLDNVVLQNSTSVGLNIKYATYVNCVNCNFSNNASLGIQTYVSSYLNFVNCQVNANGYGFQNTRPYPINTSSSNQVGFGAAIRCTTHHLTFTNCQFNDNGRDGISVGQGSFEAKFTACQALRNGDGGFTANADQTGTGLPGEGLSPFDLWYDNCEACDNYTSGITAYCSVSGVQVIGGSYYNNHREAGDQATETASFFNGIYTAGGSQDVVIRGARCYDNRNFTSVPSGSTATGSGPYTIALNNWVVGTMNYYPKLAFYNPSGVFFGYGQITSETTTSVSFNPTSYNGVTPSNLGGGWYVTQRVQHNGVFLDNNCNGSIDAVCSGHMQGPSNVVAYTGFDVVSGGYSNGQNVNLARLIVDATELLLNPTFDSNVTNWTGNYPGGSFAVDTTIARSPGSAKLVGGSSSVANADASLATNAISYVQGSWVRFSAWVYTSTFNGAFITLFWGSGYQTTAVSSAGESVWELLEITAFIPGGSSQILARINVNAGVTAYFDNLSLRSVAPPRGSNNLGITWNGQPY